MGRGGRLLLRRRKYESCQVQVPGSVDLAGLEELEPAASSAEGFLTGVSPSLLGGGRSP